ncbi:RNA polymerase Rpb7 [Armillaria mellea]|nr:RNA polymerase Rpb7 [Armillaria mellea]
MFNLAILKDTIGVHPSNFGIPPETALIAELNKKYANRVLHDVGLCVCVFDLTEAGEGKVRYGDGFLYYKVVFRLVVFRPFTSQVLLAKVKSSDADSIRLTMGFFDDIYIPSIYLPQPLSVLTPNERAFFWVPESERTPPRSCWIRPSRRGCTLMLGRSCACGVEADEQEPRRAPYQIICSIAESGLGNVSWWNPTQEEDAEGDMVMEE